MIFESESYQKLSKEFRTRVFQEAIASNIKGIIFTYVLAFNHPAGVKQLFAWIELFQPHNFDVYIVELQASLQERLQRNETAHRLQHKQSKRNLASSRQILLKNEQEWVMQSPPNMFESLPYLKINTDHLSPEKLPILL